MKWKKKGLIFSPDKNIWWQTSYGMMPTPVLRNDNTIRIYFGVTDDKVNGRTAFIDVDADCPSKILNTPDNFILDIGSPGMFDDSGAIPSSVVEVNNKEYLYYVGFQRCEKVPYMLFSGLAISTDSDTFQRYSSAPVIDRSKENYVSNAAPFVIKDNDIFKMWFWVGREWTTVNNKQYIKAEISYAESPDGLEWKLSGANCISLINETEFSVGRPWVIKEGNNYRMWYSVRYKEKLYRLGYAESPDGLSWIRKDSDVGIDVSDEGWDSEMICYPAVIKVRDKTYLFYNGNSNGKTGFGYAELTED